MIPTIYIQGTKKAANERLAKGESVIGTEYSMFDVARRDLRSMPDGTVIKFFTKMVQGSPYAASYGNWRPSKGKIV